MSAYIFLRGIHRYWFHPAVEPGQTHDSLNGEGPSGVLEEEEGQNNKYSVAWDDRLYPDAL